MRLVSNKDRHWLEKPPSANPVPVFSWRKWPYFRLALTPPGLWPCERASATHRFSVLTLLAQSCRAAYRPDRIGQSFQTVAAIAGRVTMRLRVRRRKPAGTLNAAASTAVDLIFCSALSSSDRGHQDVIIRL